MKQTTTIGLAVQTPATSCQDKHCPFHGSFKVRGRVFVGTVLTKKFHKTVQVGWERRRYVPKYERYEKRYTKLAAHVPPCLDVEQGLKVQIAETRPISKTKKFVVVQVIKE
ncbi:30S ribosomal protein S17 [Candidatus Woesearchaeota archaeon]|nr:30S ribosomal protein S17 [Candidatus Woesearchaeota archaeon]